MKYMYNVSYDNGQLVIENPAGQPCDMSWGYDKGLTIKFQGTGVKLENHNINDEDRCGVKLKFGELQSLFHYCRANPDPEQSSYIRHDLELKMIQGPYGKHWVLLVCTKSSKFVEITKSEMELHAFYTQPDPALYYKELTPAQTIYFWLKARGITGVYEDQEDTVNKFGKTDLESDISFCRSTPDLIITTAD